MEGEIQSGVIIDLLKSWQPGLAAFGLQLAAAVLILVIHRANGESERVPVHCRLDTAEEVSVYSAGGVLQRFAKDFLESEAEATV